MTRATTKKAKVGETYAVGKTPGYVRLPGGEVVTATGDYPLTEPGAHVFVVTETTFDDQGRVDSKTTETQVDVADPKPAPAPDADQ